MERGEPHPPPGGSAHGHDHAPHNHTPKVSARNARAIGLAAILTGLFMVAEVAGGLISGSLAPATC